MSLPRWMPRYIWGMALTEDEADVRAYDEAKANDDGSRFTMDDILAEIESGSR